jgi:DNA-binding response OmpR family regulator
MLRLLVVEDDPGIASVIRRALAEAGYLADVAGDGEQALQMIEAGYDVVLLDIMLPGIDGYEVCRTVRQRGITAPILMITARDTLEDKITGLDSGADDYIVKPFQLAEMLARIRALARRSALAGATLRVEDLTLDPAQRTVHRGDRRIYLSATEFSLLEFLMRHVGQVVTRKAILDHVWQYDFGGNDNVLDVYIGYLRAKIDRGSASPLIHTVRGVGFRLQR